MVVIDAARDAARDAHRAALDAHRAARRPERSVESGLPKLRGRLHQVAFLAAIPAGVLLVLSAHGTSARVAAIVYSLTVAGLFASSSLYNRALGTSRLRPWMQWIDHAMIYLLIAGTYTPVCVVNLPRRWGVPLLSVIWVAALVGVTLKLCWRARFRRIGGALYVVMGWAAVLALPQLFSHLPRTSLILVVLGGALYSVGAVVLAVRRPNPVPVWFGYHEVWHTFVVAAAMSQYAAIWLALR
jgi:hemolysin III